MSDRLSSSQTTRDFTGDYVHAPSVEVQLIIFGQSKTKADVSLYKWQPLKHECSIGITPNTFAFRVQKIPGFLGGSSAEVDADIVQLKAMLGFHIPSNPQTVVKAGFSSGNSPSVQWQINDMAKRNSPTLTYSKFPALDIWEDKIYLGRYWLCNIAQAGDDACLLIFADARYLNMTLGLVGKYYYHATSNMGNQLAYDPYSDVVFNPDNRGNKSIIATTSIERYNYAFTEDWQGSNPADSTDAHKWKLWDMLQYLWVQPSASGGYIHKINRPTLSDRWWKLWYDYGGQKTIEMDITHLTTLEAIDKIIKAAGEYTWTIEQRKGVGYDFDIRIIEYSRWATQSGITSRYSDVEYTMPEKFFTLPTRNAPLHLTTTNCVATVDVSTSQTAYRIVALGEPVVIESTFSTDSTQDYSCTYRGAAAPSGVASMEWIGDITAWQAAYTAASGSDIDKKKAADVVDGVAYKVCALKQLLTSTANSCNGFGFVSNSPSVVWKRRRFLPYRLPKPSPSIVDAGDTNEMPEVYVWVKRPNSDTWIFCEDINFPVQFAIDPAVGGIRFNQSMVTYDGSDFIPWDVTVVACVELDERLQVEIYQSDYSGKYVVCEAHDKFRRAERWNSMKPAMGTDVVSETVFDDIAKLEDYAYSKAAEFSRLKVSGKFEIPWVERIYKVGDFIGDLRSGSTYQLSKMPVKKYDVNTPVVGVDVDYQNYATTVRTENWRQ